MHNTYEFNKNNNNLKIILADKYFSMYRVVTDSTSIFNEYNLGDKKTLNSFQINLYKELNELKNNAHFPLVINIYYMDKDFTLG